MMPPTPFRPLCTALLLAALSLPAVADTPDHPSVKRPVDLPPSTTLDYRVEARQSGLTLEGDARVQWQQGNGRYSVVAESRAPLFGKILESKSEGTLDSYGLAPSAFTEKRFRKPQTVTTFDRSANAITFAEGGERYPLTGGEQDRTSAVWELIAVLRGAPKQVKPGTEWVFFVAGPRDAEKWTFRAIGPDRIQMPQGDVETMHLVRQPPPDQKGQQLDIWLAPKQQWVPARIRFTDPDGDYIEQTLVKMTPAGR